MIIEIITICCILIISITIYFGFKTLSQSYINNLIDQINKFNYYEYSQEKTNKKIISSINDNMQNISSDISKLKSLNVNNSLCINNTCINNYDLNKLVQNSKYVNLPAITVQNSLTPDYSLPVIDCITSEWTSCSKKCGGGSQNRIIVQPPKNGGKACESLNQSCNTQTCAINCVTSEWGSCSKPCGVGQESRTILQSPLNGGTECGSLTQYCNKDPCSIDCVTSEWGSCSLSCGGGMQQKKVLQEALYGGKSCGKTSQQCNINPCPIDCIMSPWSDWSTCSKTCGGGTQTRTRSVVQQANYGGKTCPTDTSQTQNCNTQTCPVDCLMSSWSGWSGCSASCGGGIQSQTRSILTQPSNGGAVCPTNLVNTQQCNTQGCPPPPPPPPPPPSQPTQYCPPASVCGDCYHYTNTGNPSCFPPGGCLFRNSCNY
jgi:hypothetical protein